MFTITEAVMNETSRRTSQFARNTKTLLFTQFSFVLCQKAVKNGVYVALHKRECIIISLR